ncbi:hypothetical protein RB195_013131 [Necator americanus]
MQSTLPILLMSLIVVCARPQYGPYGGGPFGPGGGPGGRGGPFGRPGGPGRGAFGGGFGQPPPPPPPGGLFGPIEQEIPMVQLVDTIDEIVVDSVSELEVR